MARPSRRTGQRLATLLAAGLLAGACGGGTGDEHAHQHDAAHEAGTGTVSLEHIHGLGVDPADGTLHVASHHGLFRVSGEGIRCGSPG
ncbi:hypothetical protein B0I33_11582 [Prauserella shujinwangii]|uniref:Uncharacterized protein n=1 Tax=Prauserella shujinwangii TaxID=1453103 RepID=A0A2T0LKN8_9PSEU|nr:hypothetical protein [Prauserella shujinwangii]PRX43464.1 hypothetical protein B0I33_11582 [Prauserella shujinwangii]